MRSRMRLCDISDVLYICPDTHIYVFSSCSYVSVLMLSYICAGMLHINGLLMLLYMCPPTPIYESSFYNICVLILVYAPHQRPTHAAINVSSFSYICVLILQYMCPHTRIYTRHVSSYSHICVLILVLLQYMCPHTRTYVS